MRLRAPIRPVRAFAPVLLAALLLAGCTAGPGPAASPAEGPDPSPGPSQGPPAVPSPVTSPSATPPAPPPRLVATNGTLGETRIDASTTYEIVFLLDATDRVRVNLNFGEVQKPAPYGWSGQVSLRGPDGRIVADSGTSMPESGAAFSLVLRDLGRSPDDGAGEFLARVRASHPTTLTAFTYVDDAAGGA